MTVNADAFLIDLTHHPCVSPMKPSALAPNRVLVVASYISALSLIVFVRMTFGARRR